MEKKKKERCRKCDDTGKVCCPLCGGMGYLIRPSKWNFFTPFDSCPACQKEGKTNCPECWGKKMAFAT